MEDNIFFATHHNFTAPSTKALSRSGLRKIFIFGGLAPIYGTNAKFKLCTKPSTQKKRKKKDDMHSHIQRHYERRHRKLLKFDFSAYTLFHFLFTLSNFPAFAWTKQRSVKLKKKTLIPKKRKDSGSFPTPGNIFPHSTWRPLCLLISSNCCLAAPFTFRCAGCNFGKRALESCIS